MQRACLKLALVSLQWFLESRDMAMASGILCSYYIKSLHGYKAELDSHSGVHCFRQNDILHQT